MKKCNACKIEKDVSEFYGDVSRCGGLSNKCKQCAKAYSAKWGKENPEKVLASRARNKPKHRDVRIAQATTYRQRHPREHYQACLRWASRNKDRVKMYRKDRQGRKRAGGGGVTATEWQDVLNKYGNRCLCCKRNDIPLTIDHVIPIKLGGPHAVENIQPLCRPCNSRKGARYIDYRISPESNPMQH